jgi:hypothetical protein
VGSGGGLAAFRHVFDSLMLVNEGLVLGGTAIKLIDIEKSIYTVARKGNTESARVRAGQASKRASDLMSVIDAIRAEGATSLREIAGALNDKRIPTARGGEWSAVQVQRLLSRL